MTATSPHPDDRRDAAEVDRRRPSTALLTDRYELTMLDAAHAAGTIDRRCVFELFARGLPEGRRYGVAAGLDRVLDAIAAFRFDDATLAALDDLGVVSRTDPGVAGRVPLPAATSWAVREGEVVFPGTSRPDGRRHVRRGGRCSRPCCCRSSTTTAPSRPRRRGWCRPPPTAGRCSSSAAAGPTRTPRSQPPGRPSSSGSPGTSNLEAGRRYGIATMGTSAHAFTLLHDDEPAAFRSQVAALGTGNHAARRHLRRRAGHPQRGRRPVAPTSARSASTAATRPSEAHRARALLDELGATATRIVVSGDLDEHRIAALPRRAHRRVRRRDVGRDRARCADGRLRLQARRARPPPRRAARAGRQGRRRQGDGRRVEGGRAPVGRRRSRPSPTSSTLGRAAAAGRTPAPGPGHPPLARCVHRAVARHDAGPPPPRHRRAAGRGAPASTRDRPRIPTEYRDLPSSPTDGDDVPHATPEVPT